MLNSVIVIVVTILSLSMLFSQRMRDSSVWRATVTPLASIIGSGFLVSAPLLILSTGYYAPLAMLFIVLIAYALGSSLRFNILNAESLDLNEASYRGLNYLESLSQIMLAVAYLISITFYLKLLATFLLKGVELTSLLAENMLTTGFLLFIGITGKLKGLKMLESLEVYSVNIKISIIIALIISHIFFNFDQLFNGGWSLEIYPHETAMTAIRKLLGVLIIIQGFETSRYLKGSYSKSHRIKTMKYAQIFSGIIYVVFIVSTLTAFNDIHSLNKTTVVDICKIIAPVLPFMLIFAATMSQFSAAVADTIGSGGLMVEALSNKISLNNSYFLIMTIGVILTWSTDIYSIIALASKAFAIYYGLQLGVSCYLIYNKQVKDISNWNILLYVFLILLMICVVLFGIPVKEVDH